MILVARLTGSFLSREWVGRAKRFVECVWQVGVRRSGAFQWALAAGAMWVEVLFCQ